MIIAPSDTSLSFLQILTRMFPALLFGNKTKLPITFHFFYLVSCISFFFLTFIFIFLLFRATPMAYRGSQARDRIEAVATGLCHSHSNAGSEPHLQPTPQLTAMLDP